MVNTSQNVETRSQSVTSGSYASQPSPTRKIETEQGEAAPTVGRLLRARRSRPRLADNQKHDFIPMVQCKLPLDRINIILSKIKKTELTNIDKSDSLSSDLSVQTDSNSISNNDLNSDMTTDDNMTDVETSRSTMHSPNRIMCLFCDRTFNNNALLQKHTDRSHKASSTRRFSSRKVEQAPSTSFHPGCNFCSRTGSSQTATDLTALFRHFLDEHSIEYFACRKCELRFSTKEVLICHNRDVHGNIEDERTSIVEGKCTRSSSLSPISSISLSGSSKSRSTPKCERLSDDKSKVKNRRGRTTQRQSRLAQQKEQANRKRSLQKLKSPEDAEENVSLPTTSRRSIEFNALRKVNIDQNAVIVLDDINPDNKLFKNKSILIKSDEKDNQILSRLGIAQNRSSRTRSLRRSRKAPLTESRASSETPRKDKSKAKADTHEFVINKNKNDPNSKFDPDFYSHVSSNVRENLMKFLDGKLGRQTESPIFHDLVDPKIKSTHAVLPTQPAEIHGSDVNLHAITVFPTLLTSEQYGSDKIPHYSYGANAQTFKKIITKNSWKWKWDPIKKYKYCNEDGKVVRKIRPLQHVSPRDLSKLDIWTQLTMREKFEKSKTKDTEEPVEEDESKCARQKQINELNLILDSRSFPDIEKESLRYGVLEHAPIEGNGPDGLKDDAAVILKKKSTVPNPSFLQSLGLAPKDLNASSAPVPILSGEWARPRCYICCICGRRADCLKLLEAHQAAHHPHVNSTHYEIVGQELLDTEVHKYLYLPGGKTNHDKPVKESAMKQVKKITRNILHMGRSTRILRTTTRSIKSLERGCTKCKKMLQPTEFYRHILECAGDYGWIMAKKKCKYKPFGARRKRVKGLYKREVPQEEERVELKDRVDRPKLPPRPRIKPSDAETIQRMLANLPAKRASRTNQLQEPDSTKAKTDSEKGSGQQVRDINNSVKVKRKRVLRSSVLKSVKSVLTKKVKRVTRSVSNTKISSLDDGDVEDASARSKNDQNDPLGKSSESQKTEAVKDQILHSHIDASDAESNRRPKRQISIPKNGAFSAVTNAEESIESPPKPLRKTLRRRPVVSSKLINHTFRRKTRNLKVKEYSEDPPPEEGSPPNDGDEQKADESPVELTPDSPVKPSEILSENLKSKPKKCKKKLLVFPLKWIGNKKVHFNKSKRAPKKQLVKPVPEDLPPPLPLEPVCEDKPEVLESVTLNESTETEVDNKSSNESQPDADQKVTDDKMNNEYYRQLCFNHCNLPYSYTGAPYINSAVHNDLVRNNIFLPAYNTTHLLNYPEVIHSCNPGLVYSNYPNNDVYRNNCRSFQPTVLCRNDDITNTAVVNLPPLHRECDPAIVNQPQIGECISVVGNLQQPVECNPFLYPVGLNYGLGQSGRAAIEPVRQPNHEHTLNETTEKVPLQNDIKVTTPNNVINDTLGKAVHKNKTVRLKRGLNDCIAMLKGKLNEKTTVFPEATEETTASTAIPKTDIYETEDQNNDIQQPLDLSGKSLEPEDLSIKAQENAAPPPPSEPLKVTLESDDLKDPGIIQEQAVDPKLNVPENSATSIASHPSYTVTSTNIIRHFTESFIKPDYSLDPHYFTETTYFFKTPIFCSQGTPNFFTMFASEAENKPKFDFSIPSLLSHTSTRSFAPPIIYPQIQYCLPPEGAIPTTASPQEAFKMKIPESSPSLIVKTTSPPRHYIEDILASKNPKPASEHPSSAFSISQLIPQIQISNECSCIFKPETGFEALPECPSEEFQNVDTDLYLIDPVTGIITERKFERELEHLNKLNPIQNVNIRADAINQNTVILTNPVSEQSINKISEPKDLNEVNQNEMHTDLNMYNLINLNNNDLICSPNLATSPNMSLSPNMFRETVVTHTQNVLKSMHSPKPNRSVITPVSAPIIIETPIATDAAKHNKTIQVIEIPKTHVVLNETRIVTPIPKIENLNVPKSASVIVNETHIVTPTPIIESSNTVTEISEFPIMPNVPVISEVPVSDECKIIKKRNYSQKDGIETLEVKASEIPPRSQSDDGKITRKRNNSQKPKDVPEIPQLEDISKIIEALEVQAPDVSPVQPISKKDIKSQSENCKIIKKRNYSQKQKDVVEAPEVEIPSARLISKKEIKNQSENCKIVKKRNYSQRQKDNIEPQEVEAPEIPSIQPISKKGAKNKSSDCQIIKKRNYSQRQKDAINEILEKPDEASFADNESPDKSISDNIEEEKQSSSLKRKAEVFAADKLDKTAIVENAELVVNIKSIHNYRMKLAAEENVIINESEFAVTPSNNRELISNESITKCDKEAIANKDALVNKEELVSRGFSKRAKAKAKKEDKKNTLAHIEDIHGAAIAPGELGQGNITITNKTTWPKNIDTNEIVLTANEESDDDICLADMAKKKNPVMDDVIPVTVPDVELVQALDNDTEEIVLKKYNDVPLEEVNVNNEDIQNAQQSKNSSGKENAKQNKKSNHKMCDSEINVFVESDKYNNIQYDSNDIVPAKKQKVKSISKKKNASKKHSLKKSGKMYKDFNDTKITTINSVELSENGHLIFKKQKGEPQIKPTKESPKAKHKSKNSESKKKKHSLESKSTYAAFDKVEDKEDNLQKGEESPKCFMNEKENIFTQMDTSITTKNVSIFVDKTPEPLIVEKSAIDNADVSGVSKPDTEVVQESLKCNEVIEPILTNIAVPVKKSNSIKTRILKQNAIDNIVSIPQSNDKNDAEEEQKLEDICPVLKPVSSTCIVSSNEDKDETAVANCESELDSTSVIQKDEKKNKRKRNKKKVQEEDLIIGQNSMIVTEESKSTPEPLIKNYHLRKSLATKINLKDYFEASENAPLKDFVKSNEANGIEAKSKKSKPKNKRNQSCENVNSSEETTSVQVEQPLLSDVTKPKKKSSLKKLLLDNSLEDAVVPMLPNDSFEIMQKVDNTNSSTEEVSADDKNTKVKRGKKRKNSLVNEVQSKVLNKSIVATDKPLSEMKTNIDIYELQEEDVNMLANSKTFNEEKVSILEPEEGTYRKVKRLRSSPFTVIKTPVEKEVPVKIIEKEHIKEKSDFEFDETDDNNHIDNTLYIPKLIHKRKRIPKPVIEPIENVTEEVDICTEKHIEKDNKDVNGVYNPYDTLDLFSENKSKTEKKKIHKKKKNAEAKLVLSDSDTSDKIPKKKNKKKRKLSSEDVAIVDAEVNIIDTTLTSNEPLINCFTALSSFEVNINNKKTEDYNNLLIDSPEDLDKTYKKINAEDIELINLAKAIKEDINDFGSDEILQPKSSKDDDGDSFFDKITPLPILEFGNQGLVINNASSENKPLPISDIVQSIDLSKAKGKIKNPSKKDRNKKHEPNDQFDVLLVGNDPKDTAIETNAVDSFNPDFDSNTTDAIESSDIEFDKEPAVKNKHKKNKCFSEDQIKLSKKKREKSSKEVKSSNHLVYDNNDVNIEEQIYPLNKTVETKSMEDDYDPYSISLADEELQNVTFSRQELKNKRMKLNRDSSLENVFPPEILNLHSELPDNGLNKPKTNTFESTVEKNKINSPISNLDLNEPKKKSTDEILSISVKTATPLDAPQEIAVEIDKELEDKQDKILADFGMYTEKRPRKSTILANQKIAQTFKSDTIEIEEVNKKRSSSCSQNKSLKKRSKKSQETIVTPSDDLSSDNGDGQAMETDNLDSLSDNLKDNDSKSNNYCTICKRKFRRPENLAKHQLTLMHISKLSEIEAQTLQSESEDKIQLQAVQVTPPIEKVVEKHNKDVATETDFIISMMDANLSKPYKNLAERKSFDYEVIQPQPLNIITTLSPKFYEKTEFEVINKTAIPQPVQDIGIDLARKQLSRDEALFFECCSLLKESETTRKSDIYKTPQKPLDKPHDGKQDEVIKSPIVTYNLTVKNILQASEIIPDTFKTTDDVQVLKNDNMPNRASQIIASVPKADLKMFKIMDKPIVNNESEHLMYDVYEYNESSEQLKENDTITSALKNDMEDTVESAPYCLESMIIRSNSNDFSDNGDSLISSNHTPKPFKAKESYKLCEEIAGPSNYKKSKYTSRESLNIQSSDDDSDKNCKSYDRNITPNIDPKHSFKSVKDKQDNILSSGKGKKKSLDPIITETPLIFDEYEDKFDKIKRKAREKAQAAQEAMAAAATSPSVTVKHRKKSHSTSRKSAKFTVEPSAKKSTKGHKSSKRKNHQKDTNKKVLTKGALKVFDSVKCKTPTQEISVTPKSNLKELVEYALQKDSEEMANDNSNSASLNIRCSSKDLHNDDSQISSLSFSDRDDFNYMSDDYRNNSEEDSNLSINTTDDVASTSKGIGKKNKIPKSKKVTKKSAIMGKIFKNNAIRNDQKILDEPVEETVKIDNSFTTRTQMDQLFDSLLEKDSTSNAKPSSKLNDDDEDDDDDDDNDDNDDPLPRSSGSLKPHNYETKKADNKDSSSDDDDDDDSDEGGRNRVRINPRKIIPRLKARSSDDEMLAIPSTSRIMHDDYNPQEGTSTMSFGNDNVGVASRKSQRKCTTGKQNVLVESWSSESDYEDFRQFEEYSSIPKIQKNHHRPRRSRRHRSSNDNSFLEDRFNRPGCSSGSTSNGPRNDPSTSYNNNSAEESHTAEQPRATYQSQPGTSSSNPGTSSQPNHPPSSNNDDSKKVNNDNELTRCQRGSQNKIVSAQRPSRPRVKRPPPNTKNDKDSKSRSKQKPSKQSFEFDGEFIIHLNTLNNVEEPPPVCEKRNKRSTSEMLYYWSSSTEEELLADGYELMDVEAEEAEAEAETTREPEPVEQHGWIVGDSHKKLVTMLAHAKGRKGDKEKDKDTKEKGKSDKDKGKNNKDKGKSDKDKKDKGGKGKGQGKNKDRKSKP